MGGRHTLAFSETSQDAPQIKAGIWSRSCLTKARQRDKSIIGPEIHLTAHTALGDQPGNLSICDSTVPRSHSLSPYRLTTTESCCQIAQHHPGSGNKSPALQKPTKYPGPQADHREWALAVQPALSIQVTSKQVAGAPHSKEDSKSLWGAGRRQLCRNRVCILGRPSAHLA